MSATGLAYGSVCSGIEAATAAWHPLGWRPQFFSELAEHPRAVLAHRFPEVPLHGDFTTIQAGVYGLIQLLVGGTPCQSFSVAGLRGGLADDRGNLALQYLRLARRLRPRWLVWENVPGVLSSNGGRDFGAILGGMVELGYGFAYRVLDAQYIRVDGFGRAVPQRRRRVFVVGYLGDWRRAAAVLFERACLRGDLAPRREAGAGTAVGALAGTGPGGGWRIGPDEAAGGQLVPIGLYDDPRRYTDLHGGGDHGQVHPTLESTNPKQILAYGGNDTRGPINVGATLTHHASCLDFESETFIAFGTTIAFDCKAGANTGFAIGDVPGALRGEGHGGGHAAIAYGIRSDASRDGSAKTPSADAEGRVRLRDPGLGIYESLAPTLDAGQPHTVAAGWAVRRLLPVECERLQGFPDGWTAVPWRGGIMPDGPRYKMLGNSMACNVMRWIGTRIEFVEQSGGFDGANTTVTANDMCEPRRGAA